MKTIFDIGERVGFLSVMAELPKGNGRRQYRVRCDCGTEKVVRGTDLCRIKSCGCYRRSGLIRRRHGDGGATKRAVEYHSWANMKQRCLNPNHHKFPCYGGRGIKISDRWMMYENFFADMGRRPSPVHSVDRINVNGDYEPANCRWATATEQANNRRPRKHELA